jgi:hypothetical protein
MQCRAAMDLPTLFLVLLPGIWLGTILSLVLLNSGLQRQLYLCGARLFCAVHLVRAVGTYLVLGLPLYPDRSYIAADCMTFVASYCLSSAMISLIYFHLDLSILELAAQLIVLGGLLFPATLQNTPWARSWLVAFGMLFHVGLVGLIFVGRARYRGPHRNGITGRVRDNAAEARFWSV